MVGNINDDDYNKDNNGIDVERSYLCPGNIKVTSVKRAKSIAPDFTEQHLGYKYRLAIFPVVFQIQCSPVGRPRVSVPRQALEELPMI